MVDARDSKSRSFGSEGSSPSAGISFGFRHVPQLSDVFCLRPEMSVIPLTLTCLLLLLVAIFSAVVSALETALLSLKEHHIAVIGDDRNVAEHLDVAVAELQQSGLDDGQHPGTR